MTCCFPLTRYEKIVKVVKLMTSPENLDSWIKKNKIAELESSNILDKVDAIIIPHHRYLGNYLYKSLVKFSQVNSPFN